MDVIKFFKERDRMCDYFRLRDSSVITKCIGCPLSSANNSEREGCYIFINHNPEQAIEIVEKWSDSHPVRTRADVYKQMFPNANVEMICPYALLGGMCIRKSNECSCDDCKDKFWNEPAPDWFGKGGGE